MILLSLKQRRQHERRGWQQPPVRRKMIAKEWIGGTQQSTSDGTQKVWMWECGNAKRLGGSYYDGSTGKMREEDDKDGRRGGAEVTRRRRRRGKSTRSRQVPTHFRPNQALCVSPNTLGWIVSSRNGRRRVTRGITTLVYCRI